MLICLYRHDFRDPEKFKDLLRDLGEDPDKFETLAIEIKSHSAGSLSKLERDVEAVEEWVDEVQARSADVACQHCKYIGLDANDLFKHYKQHHTTQLP